MADELGATVKSPDDRGEIVGNPDDRTDGHMYTRFGPSGGLRSEARGRSARALGGALARAGARGRADLAHEVEQPLEAAF